MTFADPPLPDAAQVVASLRGDGVGITVISADNDLVTASVR